MAAESFEKLGLYFDELNKIRVLDPKVSQETIELKEECKQFIKRIAEFQDIVDSFIKVTDTLAGQVEREKLKAIGSRNLLKSIAKHREAQQQQLNALLAEKRLQLERLKVQCEALKREDAEQNDFIEQFLLQK